MIYKFVIIINSITLLLKINILICDIIYNKKIKCVRYQLIKIVNR